MRNKILSVTISLILLAGMFAGCQSSAPQSAAQPSSDAASTAQSPSEAAPTNTEKKYAIIYSGSLGDLGFVDEGQAGMQRAADELGITFDYAECKAPSDFEPQMRLFAEAEEYEIIFGHGANFADAIKVLAADFSEQRFCLIDGNLDEIPNASAIGARDPEQSFLSGVLAGLATRDERFPMVEPDNNVLGFAIGMDSPVSRSTAAGFISGAKYVNPEVEVITAFVGGYRDPGKGKEIAMMAYGRGADIVSHNAGTAILGVFQAAEETKNYGIGTSTGSANKEYGLCTSLKRIDNVIFNEIKSDVDGQWVPGNKKYGIKEGVCDINFEGLDIEIPDDVMAIIDEVRQHVIDGKVIPAYTLEEIDEWTKNNQYDKNK